MFCDEPAMFCTAAVIVSISAILALLAISAVVFYKVCKGDFDQ